MHRKQEWTIITGVSIVGLLLLISLISISHYRLQTPKTGLPPFVDKEITLLRDVSSKKQSLSAYSDFWAYFWDNWFCFKKKGIWLVKFFVGYTFAYFLIPFACVVLLRFRGNIDIPAWQLTGKVMLDSLKGYCATILRLFNAAKIVRKAYSWVWMLLAFLPYYLVDKIFAWRFDPNSKALRHFAWVKLWVFFGVFFTLILLYNLYPWQYHDREKYGKKLSIGKRLLIACVEICCALLVSVCLTVIFCTLLLEIAILRSKQANAWTSLNKKIRLPAILQPNAGKDDEYCCICWESGQQCWNPCSTCNALLCFACFANIKRSLASNVACPLCRTAIWRESRDRCHTSWQDSYTYKAKNREPLTAAQSWQHLHVWLDSFFIELLAKAPEEEEVPEVIAPEILPEIGHAPIGQGAQQRIQQFVPQVDQLAAEKQAWHQLGVTDVLLLQTMQYFFVCFVPAVVLISWVSPVTLSYILV